MVFSLQLTACSSSSVGVLCSWMVIPLLCVFVQVLIVPEVKSLLGVNVPDLKTYESAAQIQEWIRLQLQSDLDTLQIGLTGGRNSTITETTVSTTTTSSSSTKAPSAQTSTTGTSHTLSFWEIMRGNTGANCHSQINLSIEHEQTTIYTLKSIPHTWSCS